jgi:hypothetical protein
MAARKLPIIVWTTLILGGLIGTGLYMEGFFDPAYEYTPEAELWVDNGLPHGVTVSIPGEDSKKAGPGEFAYFSVPEGTHTITVTGDDGSVVETRTVNLVWADYLYNIGGRWDYMVRTAYYAKDPEAARTNPDPELIAGSVFFEIPSGTDHVLFDMPEEITVDQYNSGGNPQRSSITHFREVNDNGIESEVEGNDGSTWTLLTRETGFVSLSPAGSYAPCDGVGTITNALSEATEVRIQGCLIGTLQPGEKITFALPRGTYSLSWGDGGSIALSVPDQQPVHVELN